MHVIFIIQQTGCTSSRLLPTESLPVNSSYVYKIRYQKSFIALKNISISNDTLSGKIESLIIPNTGKEIYVYPTSDSIVSIDENMILKVPLSNIDKSKLIVQAPGKTLIIGASVVFVMLLIIIGLQLTKPGHIWI